MYKPARISPKEFKTPWNFLAETNAEGRSPKAISSANSEWWCLFEKVRTHFEQNP
jgi:hypothetical protein